MACKTFHAAQRYLGVDCLALATNLEARGHESSGTLGRVPTRNEAITVYTWRNSSAVSGMLCSGVQLGLMPSQTHMPVSKMGGQRCKLPSHISREEDATLPKA